MKQVFKRVKHEFSGVNEPEQLVLDSNFQDFDSI